MDYQPKEHPRMHQVIVVTVRENDGYEVVRETSQADSRYHPYIRETV